MYLQILRAMKFTYNQLLKEHTTDPLFLFAHFGTPSDFDFFGTGGIGAKI